MSHQPRDRICIYCDARADSLEHVIPQWIPKQFGLTGEVMSHDRAIGITNMSGVRFGDFAARIYCHVHHEHINRTVENKPTRDLIRQLFTAEAATLDRDAQTRLAAWAAKTCYAQWGMVRRRRGIPAAHRRHLMQQGEPHPSVFVSISRCTGDRVRILFARTEVTSAADGGVSHWYDYVLAIGQLAFKVWGPSDRRRAVAYKTPTTIATRIWPIAGEIARWPPGRILDDDGITEVWDYDPRAEETSKQRS